MMEKFNRRFLYFSFFLQFLLIAGVFINAYSVIWFGEERTVWAKGVDPRDILSGNFIQLDYLLTLKNGEKTSAFNVSLNKDKNYFLVFEKKNENIFDLILQEEKPQNAVYIEPEKNRFGRLILPNIQRYYVPLEDAKMLERKLNAPNSLAKVTLKVWRGRARIVRFNLEK